MATELIKANTKQNKSQSQLVLDHQQLMEMIKQKYKQSKYQLMKHFQQILGQWSYQSVSYCIEKYQQFHKSKDIYHIGQQACHKLISQITQSNENIVRATQKSLINIKNIYLKVNIHLNSLNIGPQKQAKKIILKRKSLSVGLNSSGKHHSLKAFSLFQSTKYSLNRQKGSNSTYSNLIFTASQSDFKKSVPKMRTSCNWIKQKFVKKQNVDVKLKKTAMQKFNSAIRNIVSLKKQQINQHPFQPNQNNNQSFIQKKILSLQQKLEKKLNSILSEIKNCSQAKCNVENRQICKQQQKESPLNQNKSLKKVQLMQRSLLIDQKKSIPRNSIKKDEKQAKPNTKKSLNYLKNNTIQDEQDIESVSFEQQAKQNHIKKSLNNGQMNKYQRVSEKDLIDNQSYICNAFNQFFRITKKVKLPISQKILSIMFLNIKNKSQKLLSKLQFDKQPVYFTEQQAKKILLDGLQDLTKLLALKCKQDKKEKLSAYTRACLNCIKAVILKEDQCVSSEMPKEIKVMINKLSYYPILQY